MSVQEKTLTITIDLPVKYKALMQGDNVVVLDASIAGTYYPLTPLPEESRTKILNAICNQVRIDDFEANMNLNDSDPFAAKEPA